MKAILEKGFKGAIGAVLIVSAFFLITPFGLILNTTASLPTTLFLSLKKQEVTRGQYAFFTHPCFDQVVIKKVVGVAGDRVYRKGSEVFVNDVLVGTLKEKCSTGQPLTPVAEQKIPENAYFVAGLSERSFDSRYADFGFIQKGQMLGRAWALF